MKHQVRTISLPSELLAGGIARANAFGLKFSHYVGMLIEKDVAEGGNVLMIKAKPPESSGSNASLGSLLLAASLLPCVLSAA